MPAQKSAKPASPAAKPVAGKPVKPVVNTAPQPKAQLKVVPPTPAPKAAAKSATKAITPVSVTKSPAKPAAEPKKIAVKAAAATDET